MKTTSHIGHEFLGRTQTWRALPCGRTSLLGAVVLAVVAASAPDVVSATDFSFFGATTLAAGSHAGYVTVGLPDAEIGAVFGLSSIADITPRLRLQYGRSTRVGGFGVAAGTQLRMKFARAARWTFAVVAEPEISVHMWGVDHPPTTTTGVPALALSPFAAGLVADRQVLSGVRLTAGIKVPLTFYLSPEWVMNVPLIAELGVESALAPGMVVLARVDAGADFYGPGGLPGVESYFRVRVGIGWSK